MKLYRANFIAEGMFALSILTFLPACSQHNLKTAHQAAAQIQAIASTQPLPDNATPSEKKLHTFIQAVSPTIPFGPPSLAIITAIAGLAGTIIQTFRKQKAVAAHRQAVAELSAQLNPAQQLTLTPATKLIVHRSQG